MTPQHTEANTQAIAVIDDDAILLRLMSELLTEEGYQTITHQVSSSNYCDLRDQQPDLIILDIRIGTERDAWALLDLLKLDPTTTHIPSIVCSTNRQLLEAKAEYFQEQGIRPLEKPFTLNTLLETIKAVLNT